MNVTASTDIGPAVFGFDMTSYPHRPTRSVYLAVLRKDLPSPLAPESDEEKIADASAPEKKDEPAKPPTPDAKADASTATAANYHLASIIDGLAGQGLERCDAEAFAAFICNEYAIKNGGDSDHASEECVSDEQYDRLTIG